MPAFWSVRGIVEGESTSGDAVSGARRRSFFFLAAPTDLLSVWSAMGSMIGPSTGVGASAPIARRGSG